MNFFLDLKYKLKPSTVIISIIIITFLIVVILEIFQNIFNKVEEKKIEESNPNVTFYSAEKDVSLEIAKKYEVKQYNSNNKYLIELRSNINLDIFISKRDLIENKNLFDITSSDKRAYLEEFESTNNISDLTEMNVYNDKDIFFYNI